MVRAEIQRHAVHSTVTDGHRFIKKLTYTHENFVSSHKNAPFVGLGAFLLLSVIVFGFIWGKVDKSENTEKSFWFGCWYSFQWIVAGGSDTSIQNAGHIAVIAGLLLCGMFIFAILVGVITQAFHEAISRITDGRTSVVTSGHTIILGWNEATLRTICQIAFLRRQWAIANSTFARKWLRVGRILASTPLAVAPIIIMCNTKTKVDMEADIHHAFLDRGICPQRTKLGWDVVCRVGDPTNVQDLRRVAAASATSIMVQMTDEDDRETHDNAGTIENGMTLRTVLALRYVFFTSTTKPDWDNLRIVVQLQHPSMAIEAATFTSPTGRRVVLVQDLSLFLNNLMFTCTTSAGLAAVFSDLLSFESSAIRARRADSFPDKGASIIGKTMSEAVFAWEDGLVIGAIGRDGEAIIDNDNENDGICPRGSRIITPDDRVIFLSKTSAPRVMTRLQSLPNPSVSNPHSGQQPSPMNLLVCGWRKQWEDPVRFGFRLVDTMNRFEQGSHITFLTKQHDEASFAELVRKADIPRLQNTGGIWCYSKWVTFIQRSGEATDVKDLNTVLQESKRPYSRALILSDPELPAYSRDTRIMTVMVLLRYLQQQLSLPAISIIAENAQDQTSMLATGPIDPGENRTLDPDFVNMQAIQARALTQCLAYPKIAPAISQLFSSAPKSPNIVMERATVFAEAGLKMPFHKLQQCVQNESSDICLGWRRSSGKITLCPLANDIFEVDINSQLILISRAGRKIPDDAGEDTAQDVRRHSV